jgi:hypothetical protein
LFAFEEYIKNHKILILNNAEQLDRYENITCDRCYVSWSTWWTKTLFKIYEHLPAGWLDRSRWYGDWKHHVEDYDVIIIINQVRGRDVVEYMRARNPKARIIIYYETTIDPADRKAPQHYRNLGVEFSSFDKKDCDLWNLRYVPYFYSFWNGSNEILIGDKTCGNLRAISRITKLLCWALGNALPIDTRILTTGRSILIRAVGWFAICSNCMNICHGH